MNAIPVNQKEILTYVFLGQDETAVKRLRSLLSWARPATPTPRRLAMNPDFDDLRGHPDFEKLLEELVANEK
jgi:hypothetical protein